MRRLCGFTVTGSASPNKRPSRETGDARVTILEAGGATLELANPAQKKMIDGVRRRAGRRASSDPVAVTQLPHERTSRAPGDALPRAGTTR